VVVAVAFAGDAGERRCRVDRGVQTRADGAEAARAAYGARLAFDDWRKMVVSPEIDPVAVVVCVPSHYEPTKAALEAAKHVYCEWPHMTAGFARACNPIAVTSPLAFASSASSTASAFVRVFERAGGRRLCR
jgi:hypothetical protein